MARSRPLTMRHFVFTVLVVVLVNAQLTWWIIFVLRQNRSLLELERNRMAGGCAVEVARVRLELDTARSILMEWIVSREGWGSSGIWRWPAESPPEPFDTWADPVQLIGEPGWHRMAGDRLRFEFPGDHAMNGVVTAVGWGTGLLEVGEGFEIVETDGAMPVGGARPIESMPMPFAGLAVAPTESAWDEVLDGYRRRILMMVSEGAFFAVMLFLLIGLLWRTLRREVELQRQHRNFLSAITHELKSPLAGTRLALETVISGRADEVASARFLNNALQDTERLQDLVQKVLETTRYGHGIRLELRRVCLSDMVWEAIEGVNSRVEALGGEIVADVISECQVGADEEAFRIVISNLLDNAIKYGGDPPRINVRLGLQSDWAVVEVSDNGAGIPEDDLSLVFQRFFRSGDELSRTTRGTGLGLYLVEQIVRAHRGTVEVTATGPDGTTFRVEIPGAELKESGP